MLVSLVSIVSFQPLPRTTLSNGRVSRAAASMQLPQMPDFGKSLQNMMPGGGDDSGLSKEQAEEMEARMKTGGMTFDDFLMQTKVMQKAGSMQAMMKKMPFGGGGSISDEQLREGELKLKRFGAFVELMSEEERQDPEIILSEMKGMKTGQAPVRMQRIADAAGKDLSQVQSFVSEFSSLRSAAQKFANGANPDDIRREMMEEKAAEGPPPNRAQRRAAKRKKGGASRGARGGFAPGR